MNKNKWTEGTWKAFRKPIFVADGWGHRSNGHDPDRWVLKSDIERPAEDIGLTTIHFAEFFRCGQMSNEELEANVRISAAAPAMAEALETAKTALCKIRACSVAGASEGYLHPEKWGDALFQSHADVHQALAKINAALALARGETTK